MSEDQAFWDGFSRKREDEWTQALSRLLQFDTVSGDPAPEAVKAWRAKISEGFAYLKQLAEGLGFVTRQYEDRVLVIEQAGPEGAPVLGLPIHLDVVPAGEGWVHEPFGGEIADGAVWGRGSQDDKGPIIEAIYALAGATEWAAVAGRSFSKTVRIIILSEEETGAWDDIPYYFEREDPPSFSIVPDAAFPITVGEKGMTNLNVDFAWDPALGDVFEVRSGERANVVPAKARLRAGPSLIEGLTGIDQLGKELKDAPKPPTIRHDGDGLDIEFYGVGAHGSLPHKGYNAAADALAQAAALPGLRSGSAGRVLAWLAEVARSIDGSFIGIKHTDPKVGRTTVNLGVLVVDASSAHAVLNIRNPIGLTCPEVEKRVRAAAEKLGRWTSGLTRNEVQLSEIRHEPIYVDSEQFPDWIGPMKEAYTAVTGRETTLETIGGTTFAKAFPNAVCFGPLDENDEKGLAHQADEHVTLKALRRNVEIYGRAIVGIAL